MVAVLEAKRTEKPTEGSRFYDPLGSAVDILLSRDPEIMCDGPAGTGKSRAWLEKIHWLAQRYPRSRHLICRKTRASLTQSALVTFEDHVLPEGSPIKAGPTRDHRSSYRYPNGSEIVLGGLGDAEEKTKVMSTEYDTIYVQEAREITEGEWMDLSSRLRNGRMPYQQLCGDTNPATPTHWIKQRAAGGHLRLVQSRHEDNPTVTEAYLDRLRSLSGVRYKRLFLGLWVAAEGIVYEDWDAAVHLVERCEVPSDWPRYLAIDFGWSNPLVVQWWAADPDGRLIRYRELYGSHHLVEDIAHQIRALSSGEKIRAIVCDHDAGERAALERHLSTCDCADATGLPRVTCSTSAAKKDVSPGIQAVSRRLRDAGDGKPRLRFMRDSLVGAPDPLLLENHRPTRTEDEFEGYVWDEATRKVNPDGTYKAEDPLKKDDHGMDACRYMVAYFDLKDARTLVMGKALPMGMPAGKRQEPSPDYRGGKVMQDGQELLMPKWDIQ